MKERKSIKIYDEHLPDYSLPEKDFKRKEDSYYRKAGKSMKDLQESVKSNL